jgi:hypothetical protein
MTTQSSRTAMWIGGGLAALAVAYLVSPVFSTQGNMPDYGDSPLDPRPNSSVFSPQYFLVVYLKFEGDHMIARHAYFAGKQPNQSTLDSAINKLRLNSPGTPGDGLPQPTGGVIRQNFEDFDFGKQIEIYSVVDNARATFNAINPITFTPYGAHDVPKGPATRDKNKSFYGANTTRLTADGKKILYLENVFRDKNGADIQDDSSNPVGNGGSASTLKIARPPLASKYSMNFNLLMCKQTATPCDFASPAHLIPLVIDPDTGNGKGLPPPSVP